MSKRDLFKRVLPSMGLLLVGVLVGWAFFTGSAGQWFKAAQVPSVQAAESSLSAAPAVPAAPAGEEWFTCSSVGVAAYANRIHVECNPGTPAGIRYFALSTSQSAHAARILSILSMAHVTGKNLEILYDPDDTSGAAFGCQENDCRLIDAAIIWP